MKRIGILAYGGVTGLDITGPMEALANARVPGSGSGSGSGSTATAYELLLVSPRGGRIRCEHGLRLSTDCSLEETPPLDTLIIPGGSGLRAPDTNRTVAAWVKRRAPSTRRVVTVCTGIYGLAPTGLLDGRRVTTHWQFAEDVARRFPRLQVDRNALYVQDGRFWTSGGITAGIDLTLALIEEDLGPRAALAVARELVVFLKRPGGQEQFSEPLRDQMRSADRFAELVAWMQGHLQADLSILALAQRCHMSPRHFSRCFRASLGRSPAQYVEDLRLGAARERLTRPRQSVERVARSVGYDSADVFARRFRERFGVSPRAYRASFS